MSDRAALQDYRDRRHFEGWDGFVDAKHVEAAEASVRRLADDLIALGPDPAEDAARRLVDDCIRRFNDLDDGWICTIERDDIAEQVWEAIDLAGFEGDEDWLDERDW